jgi:putative phosphoesterase
MDHAESGAAALRAHERRRRVGLISDTHGLLRAEALAALRGSDFIVHAGDIGDPAIVEQLAEIAPVTAVRGNNDTAPWSMRLPEFARLDVGSMRIAVIHDLSRFEVDPVAERIDVVVSGHSHRPACVRSGGGVLYVNPGSAGPRRFRLPVSIAMLSIAGDRIESELVELAINARSAIPRPGLHRPELR